MSDFLRNEKRQGAADRDASTSVAVRAAGAVVGLSLAAVALWLAVRRSSGESTDWRRSAEDDEVTRSRSANPEAPLTVSSTEDEIEADEDGEVLPENVVQLTTRSRLPGGKEAIEQFVRCTFAGSDLQSVVHAAFCPPLMTKPTLDVDQLEGPEATIKTTLAEVFGARLEVRLVEPAEQGTEVMLRIHAVG